MNDSDLLALCVLEEAGGEANDGRAAIARVIKNRMALKYMSDGTIAGTILKYHQFSWLWFKYVNGKPVEISKNSDEALTVAEDKLAQAAPIPFQQCDTIADQVMADTYSGPAYDNLTDDAVLYLNPNPALVPHLPAWASPEKLVCSIGHHNFYRG